MGHATITSCTQSPIVAATSADFGDLRETTVGESMREGYVVSGRSVRESGSGIASQDRELVSNYSEDDASSNALAVHKDSAFITGTDVGVLIASWNCCVNVPIRQLRQILASPTVLGKSKIVCLQEVYCPPTTIDHVTELSNRHLYYSAIDLSLIHI